MKKITYIAYVITPLSIALVLRSTVNVDRFDGNERNYTKLGITQELIRFNLEFLDPQQGGQLNINYSYLESLATDSTWGVGIRRTFGKENFRDLTTCPAVQIKVKGDGSLNTFHFELVEINENSGICQADSETWASPNVSLSSTEWQTMIIPTTHFRRLADAESRQTIGDYFEGDSCFVPKIERYHFIMTGKVETDTTQDFFNLSEFKGIDFQSVHPLLPIIDDFELNSTVPYPRQIGEALPTFQYNWNHAQSGETALQVYFNPLNTESGKSAGQGGIRTVLPEAIDLTSYSSIGFYLKGDGSTNSLRLQLVETTQAGGMKTIASPPVALDNTAWQFVELPLLCFTTEVDSLPDENEQLVLVGYDVVFFGSDTPDEHTNFIFIDALQLGTGIGDERTTTLPVIDSFEGCVSDGFTKFGPCFLDWITSSTVTEGNTSLAITYRHDCPDSISNQWGAGLRRILPQEIDLRYYKTIEFDLMGDGSQNQVRLEFVESLQQPADGETWASDFINLDRRSWQRITLNLDEDFHLLLDRFDNIYPDYVAGNQTRNHRFREYHLVFIGQDIPREGSQVLFDNFCATGQEKPDKGAIINSLVISEPHFSPFRGNVVFKVSPDSSAHVTKITLKIYHISGELVAEIDSGNIAASQNEVEMAWDGKNKNGQMLPNGLYMVMMKTRDNRGREHNGLDHPKFIEILK